MALSVAGVALGSNLGDREANLRRALVRLEKTPDLVVLRRSTWHETAPVGGPSGQGDYLNGACLLETSLDPRALLARLHEIEDRCGRVRAEEGGPRTLDLDLLWYGEESSDDPALQLPHPRMEERTFVLAPLAEVAPGHVLPGCGKTVEERLAELQG